MLEIHATVCRNTQVLQIHAMVYRDTKVSEIHDKVVSGIHATVVTDSYTVMNMAALA